MITDRDLESLTQALSSDFKKKPDSALGQLITLLEELRLRRQFDAETAIRLGEMEDEIAEGSLKAQQRVEQKEKKR